MTRFADIRTEWRVDEIERNLARKVDEHEVYSLRRDVDAIAGTLRELSAVVREFCAQRSDLEARIDTLERDRP